MKFNLHMIFPLVAALFFVGCSGDDIESEGATSTAVEDGVRRVLFDKHGVVQISHGDKRIFTRDESGSMPRAPINDGPAAPADALSLELIARAGESQVTRAASLVPPKPISTPAAEAANDALSAARLEPLPAKVSPQIPSATYAVQVGFFGSISNAENLRDHLGNDGWPVKLVSTLAKSGKRFYLVVVPVPGERSEANRAKQKIAKKHKLEGLVITMASLPR